jgi:uncharacterized protein
MVETRRPTLAGFAATAAWLGTEPRWTNPEPTVLTIEAPPRTDHFVDPGTGAVKVDSPAWLTPAAAPATLRARVSVDFQDTFDAGALMAYETPERWAKLCFERAPDGWPMVVSVVTHGISDDANAGVVTAGAIWLRLSVRGSSYAFHASEDGERWELVRHFRLGGDGALPRVGFSAQAPTGTGCSATFERISLAHGVEDDLRSGR